MQQKDFQTYIGYIRVGDTNNFIVYEVKSPTYKTARIRLKSICKRHIDGEYTLEHLIKPEEVAPTVNIVQRREITI